MKKSNSLWIVLLVVLVAGYSALWWVKTDYLKKHLVTVIERINLNESNAFTIKYDAIERKGFPFSAEVALKNPRLTIIDEEEKEINSLNVSTDGLFVVGTSLFFNKAWVTISGESTILAKDTNPESKKQTNGHWLLKGDFSIGCDCADHFLLIDRNVGFNDQDEFIKWLYELPHDLIIQAKHLDLSEMHDQTHTFLTSLEKGSFKLNQVNRDKQTTEYSIDLNIKNLVTLPNIDFVNTLPGLTSEMLDKKTLNTIMEPSTTNVVFEANVTIPLLDNPYYAYPSRDILPTFSFDIKRYEWNNKNSLASLNGKGNVAIKNVPEKSLESTIKNKTTISFSEKEHQIVLRLYDAFVKAVQEKNLMQRNPVYKRVLVNHAEEVKKLIPNLSSFGKIEQEFDFVLVSNEKDKSLQFDNVSAELKQLSITSDLYGVEFKGKLKTVDRIYNGNLTLEIINYKDLTSDFVNYYNRWQRLLTSSKETTEEMLPYINAKVMNQVLQYLRTISDKPKDSGKTLSITVVVEESNPVKVGTLSVPEFFQDTMQLNEEVKPELFPQQQ